GGTGQKSHQRGRREAQARAKRERDSAKPQAIGRSLKQSGVPTMAWPVGPTLIKWRSNELWISRIDTHRVRGSLRRCANEMDAAQNAMGRSGYPGHLHQR